MKRISVWPVWLLLLSQLCLAASAAARPQLSVAEQPGNMFLAGDEIALTRGFEQGGAWTLLDYDDQPIASVEATNGRVRLGCLPIGFYRLRPVDGPGKPWISVGVVAPPVGSTRPTSPIGLDVAMAWFYASNRMAAVSRLCRIAGVSWVRDRLNWAEMEPAQHTFAATNRYDHAARFQSQAGLRVLQVIHLSPGWANPDHRRFPLDLRDAYNFFEAMARRWRGQVQAFEPWNEADIPMFGGHTGAEMAALQKAAYLGLKAGNPRMIVCQNVFALPNQAQLADLDANQAWPYFDTFNLHHYQPFDAYPGIYSAYRAVSAGRPLWVTECALPVQWAGDDQLKEPTDADLRVQSERVAKTFACSLHEGSAATFYFLLPHYSEGQTQFGIVRPDLTPRPAFVALAAVGRLLADAQPLGRWTCTNSSVRAFLFRARPEGKTREVLLAWSADGTIHQELPLAPVLTFDHLGRSLRATADLTLTPAPVFVVFPSHSDRRFGLSAPPKLAEFLEGDPSPIVLQALWPKEKTALTNSAYRIPTREPAQIPVYAYNFCPRIAKGRLRGLAPAGWKLSVPEVVELAPRERKQLPLLLERGDSSTQATETIQVSGDFGRAGKPILCFRVMPQAE